MLEELVSDTGKRRSDGHSDGRSKHVRTGQETQGAMKNVDLTGILIKLQRNISIDCNRIQKIFEENVINYWSV